MKSWNFWTQAIKTYFASEADEGLFLIQPGQFDTFNAKLGKDVIDSFTQSNRHSLQRESGVFFGSGTRLWNLGLFISLPVILKQVPDLPEELDRNLTVF